MSKTNTTYQALDYQKKIILAAQAYCESGNVTIGMLAQRFNVSENTISTWFCEAVEKYYIASDSICHYIMKKHIKEYEQKHMITNSCLRALYKTAFEARNNFFATPA